MNIWSGILLYNLKISEYSIWLFFCRQSVNEYSLQNSFLIIPSYVLTVIFGSKLSELRANCFTWIKITFCQQSGELILG